MQRKNTNWTRRGCLTQQNEECSPRYAATQILRDNKAWTHSDIGDRLELSKSVAGQRNGTDRKPFRLGSRTERCEICECPTQLQREWKRTRNGTAAGLLVIHQHKVTRQACSTVYVVLRNDKRYTKKPIRKLDLESFYGHVVIISRAVLKLSAIPR